MRIGLDTHAAEDEGTGNGTYIRGLVRALLARDEVSEYVLYALDPGHPFYAGLPRRTGLRVRGMGAKNPVLRIPVFLAAATVRDRLDILHVQYIAPPVHRGRLVATVHDLGFLRVPGTFSKGFVWRSRVLIRRTARRAAAVITGSEHARRDILSTYKVPEDRVEVVPCGVDPAFFSPADPAAVEAAAARYGLTGPYVLCVGRLNPRKNLPALARAFARFKKETGRPHRLVIVGRADFETERTRAEVREEGGPDVLLTGVVPDADLPDLVKGAEIFVYPSLFEGVGLPAAEALAAGVPVITSNTTSMPETAGGAALLVDPLREDELAAALARLASDPDLRRSLSEKGRLRAKAFSWDEAARRTLAIYDRVVR